MLTFDGLGHFVVTVGFTGAKRATGYAFTEYIDVANSGKTRRYLPAQSGTLLFRSSLTKRVIGTLPSSGRTSVTVILGGHYTLASKSGSCLVTGTASGSIS